MKSFIDNKFVCVPYSSPWRNFFTQKIIVGDVCILEFFVFFFLIKTRLKYLCDLLRLLHILATHTSQCAINGVKNVLSWAILSFTFSSSVKNFNFFDIWTCLRLMLHSVYLRSIFFHCRHHLPWGVWNKYYSERATAMIIEINKNAICMRRKKMSSHIIEYKTAQNIKQRRIGAWKERNSFFFFRRKICHLPFGRARKKRENCIHQKI